MIGGSDLLLCSVALIHILRKVCTEEVGLLDIDLC